ncbi:MAG: hypothetical protein A2176_14290 [Spirochaetes bacterium RBG_13_51_14]|nr:MAG: hypothetical protein A2176_14290 [Spirochaetes bacterium RBG_13_51_14]
MREIIHLSSETLLIDWNLILKKIGVSGNKDHIKIINDIFRTAKEKFLESCNPTGIISDITIEEFDAVYRGEGKNESLTPLTAIFRRADNLALYIVTLGNVLSQMITDLIKSNSITMAHMMDIIASEVTEIVADSIQNYYIKKLSEKDLINERTRVLRYSPGYCGWHISAQKKIFKHVRPEEIGISLNDGFIMDPLKSSSGVMISGPGEIHNFKNNFIFCQKCETHNCRERIKAGTLN